MEVFLCNPKLKYICGEYSLFFAVDCHCQQLIDYLHVYAQHCRPVVPPQAVLSGSTPPHFFSLLKQFICGEPDEKISLTKV